MIYVTFLADFPGFVIAGYTVLSGDDADVCHGCGNVETGHRVEDLIFSFYFAALLFKEPVHVADVPHQELEGTRVIAGDRLAHIDEIWVVMV